MVALKNGVVQNKAGYPFDRSIGTWQNQNVAENPNVVQENVSNSDGENTSTNKKPDATTENSNSAETQQTDTKKAQTDTAKEKTPAETPKPTAETPKPTAETLKPTAETLKPTAETLKPTAETLKPTAETLKPTAETPKPHIISYNIDGKQVLIPFDDLPHFNELRRQLASGAPLDDDLIRKIRSILTETHLRDGTKIFNNNSKLSQLDDAMKRYRGKQISSLDDFLKIVLHAIR